MTDKLPSIIGTLSMDVPNTQHIQVITKSCTRTDKESMLVNLSEILYRATLRPIATLLIIIGYCKYSSRLITEQNRTFRFLKSLKQNVSALKEAYGRLTAFHSINAKTYQSYMQCTFQNILY